MESVIPLIDFEDGKLHCIDLLPIELGCGKKHSQIGWPRVAENMGILERLARMSEPFGTKILIDKGIGRIVL